MNATLVVGMLLVIAVVGAYIGISGLAQQYAIAPGNSQAGSVVCAAQPPVAAIGQSVRWSTSGLPTGARYHWASDEGRTEVTPVGQLSVVYTKPGTKTVHLFYELKGSWHDTSCMVRVQ
jgi:hypothetical protein